MAFDLQDMFRQSQATYKGVVQGYLNSDNRQRQMKKQQLRRYTALGDQVMGDIQNVGTVESQRIANQFKQQYAQAEQDLINRGLGSSTLLANIQRGFSADEARAQADLSERVGVMRAGFRTNIGLAGLGYAAGANQQRVGTNLAGLGFQGGYAQQQLGIGAQSYENAENRRTQLELARMGTIHPAISGGGGFGGGGFQPSYYGGGGGYRPFQESYNPPQAPFDNTATRYVGGGGGYNYNYSPNSGGGVATGYGNKNSARLDEWWAGFQE